MLCSFFDVFAFTKHTDTNLKDVLGGTVGHYFETLTEMILYCVFI